MKTFSSALKRASRLVIFMIAVSVRADGWNYWGQVNTPATNASTASSALSQMATDGTNFYYATAVDGVWSASLADPNHVFAEMPMTGFPLWDANTNTNGFAVWYLATTPQGTLVIAGSSINIVSGVLNYDPASGDTNTLPVFYWWDAANQLWQAASVSNKSYPYTAVVGNFCVAPDGSLWTCSGFSSYAYRSTDGGHSYTAIDINASVPTNYFPMPLSGDGAFGAIFGVVAGPNNQVVVGTETGGYLQTTNNGQSWTSLDPNFTSASSADPLGRIGNATITGNDRYGDFLCNNLEFATDFPGLATWSGVTLIGYRPADGSYYSAANGFPPNYLPLNVVTPPSGVSFTFVNQTPSLQSGIYRSSDGRNWTQFNNNIPALGMPTGRSLGLHLATLGNLVFAGVSGSIYYYDSTRPPITNFPPVAEAQNINLWENSPTNLTLAAAAAAGDALNFTIVHPPANGLLSGVAPNLTYTPANNFTGLDQLLFTVDDGTATSAPVAVNFSVNSSTNPPPTITVTSPPNQSWLLAPANIALSATASGATGIGQVSFYNGTNLLIAIANPPYAFTWTNPPSGDYTLNACATSESGAAFWAPPVIISILPAAPVLGIQQADAMDVTVTWPLELESFYLESAANANGPWALSPFPPFYLAGGQTTTIPVVGLQFFRLMHSR